MPKTRDIDEDLIRAFEKAWSADSRIEDFLPTHDADSGLATLIELVAIDMEFRWKHDESISRPLVEDYLIRFPGLQVDAVEQLIEAEFSVRRARNDPPATTEYVDRFPQLETLLASLDAKYPLAHSTPLAPTIVGYKLHQKIGEGGMGAVYLADQLEPVHRQVAVKVIRRGMDSVEVIARFEAERQALAMMDHQNIARIYDAGTTDDRQPFFAMGYVDGISITDYCRNTRMTIPERLELFCDVCSAVQHAHQKGILHRDLKPSNVLVAEEDGKPLAKVIDFGLAKALDCTEQLTDKTMQTHTGQVLGTLKYMSPEQASMQPETVDTRADVYALGVILFELLVGQTPIDDASIREQGVLTALELIRDFEASPPSTRLTRHVEASQAVSAERQTSTPALRQLLRGDLDWIVMRALENDRDQRFGSASSLEDDVQRFLNDEPVVARPPSTIYRLQKFTKKNRVLVVFGLATFAILLFGIAGTTWQAIRATEAEGDAINQKEIAIQKAGESERRRIEADELRAVETAARQREAAEAARVRKILDFVISSYDAADPMKGARSDMLARDVLVQALDDVETNVAGDPLSQAELYFALASSLNGLGDYASAIRGAQLAKTRFAECPDAGWEKQIEANNLLANALLAKGDAYRAWDCYTNSMMLIRRIPDEGSQHNTNAAKVKNVTVDSLIGIARATVAPSSGMQEFAENAARNAVHAARERFGENHSKTLEATSVLADSLMLGKQHQQAIRLYQRIQQHRKDMLGASHPDTVAAMVQLSDVFLAVDRWEEAIQICQDAVTLLQESLGQSHPRTSEATCQLAHAHGIAGQWETGRRLLDAVRGRFHTSHPSYRRAARSYARMYLSAKDDAEEVWELYVGSDVDIVWAHIALGEPTAAAQSLGMWAQREPVGENQRRILKRQVSMLMWARDTDAITAAVAHEKQVRLLDKVPQSQEFLFRLAGVQILMEEANFEKAQAILQAILENAVVESIENAPDLAAVSGELTISNAAGHLSTMDRAWCESMLALCQAELTLNLTAAHDSAVNAFEQLDSRMEQMPEYVRWSVGRTCEHVVRISELQNNQGEAEQWRDKLQEIESRRWQLTLEDTWHDSLFDFQVGEAKGDKAY